MSDFNPGPGWREVKDGELRGEHYFTLIDSDLSHRPDIRRTWVREEPVPPLPTEPGSLIRVTWAKETTAKLWPSLLVLGLTHDWAWAAVGREGFIDVHDLPKWITGWQPVSEPRAVTAKVIAEFLEAEASSVAADHWCNRAATTIRREFGVES